MSRYQAISLVILMVLCNVYGQLIFKWRISEFGPMPDAWIQRIFFVMRLLLTPWIFSSFLASVLAVVLWLIALYRLPLSEAYPWTSLSFVFVTFFSYLFFGEPLTWQRILCILLITTGIWVGNMK